MTLKEYLYVDDRRLASYAEQIGPPVTYDKVPVWNAELSVLGPKVEGRQERHARELSRSERIELLVKHLEKHRLLWSRRPDGDHLEERVFVLERCWAESAVLPANPKGAPPHQGIKLWLSGPLLHSGSAPADTESRPEERLLLLLEDCCRQDPGAREVAIHWTSYSLLRALSEDVRHEEWNALQLDDLREPDWRDLRRDPRGQLQALGFHLGEPRCVEVLYRIRAISEGIFGYPIYIADTPTGN